MARPTGLAPALLRLSDRCEGNITVLFAVSLMALIVVCGAAIDYGRYLTSKTALEAAVDAAALQVNARVSTDETEMRTLAKAVLEDTYTSTGFGEIDDTELTIGEDTLTLSAEAELPSTFFGLAGVSEMTLEHTTELSKSATDLEVALVIDTSSNSDTTIDTVRSSVAALAETVFDKTDPSKSARLSIVPYDVAVNPGSLAEDARGPITSGTCLTVGCEYYQAKNYWGNYKIYDWTTCVSERTGDYAYTDDPPRKSYVSYFYQAPEKPLCRNALLPLTDDLDAIEATMTGLSTAGLRAGHLGLAWGWYSLSATFNIWTGDSVPASYDSGTQKVMVLMTNGTFDIEYCNGIYSMSSTAGKAIKANCDSPNGSSMSQAAKLCSAIKEKGIVIYTIGYNLADASMKDMLATCASGESYAFLPDTTSNLESVFKQIAEELTTVRVSR